MRTVRILGTHGVPADYGGFETAAEQVGLYLRDQGWRVVVYCQAEGDGPVVEDTWNGLERVTIPVAATAGSARRSSTCARSGTRSSIAATSA